MLYGILVQDLEPLIKKWGSCARIQQCISASGLEEFVVCSNAFTCTQTVVVQVFVVDGSE